MSRSNAAAALLFRRKGDGSTLNLDFTKMSALDSRFTFTRSTTATYINSSGYVATMAAAATNDPTKARFDYDPTTLAAKGLLIEGSAINLFIHSADYTNAAWSKSDVTATEASGTSPENANTAVSIFENSTSYAEHNFQQSRLVSTGNVYTFSLWAKEPTSNSRRYLIMQIADGQATAARFTINIDLQAGTIVTTGTINGTAGAPTGTASSISAYPNGWYRCTVTMNCIGAGAYPAVKLNNGATLNGSGISQYYNASSPYKGVLVWGAQFELGTGASSYIPTVASQVTRATDACSMSGTNFSSWFNNTEGTVLFIGNNTIVPAPSNFSANWALISAANSSRITQYTRHTTGRIGASCRDSGGGALTFDSPSATTLITTTAEYKTAFALKSSDFAYSVNGAAVGLGDGVGVFETVTSLDFARDGIRNGHIKCFKFWSTRLTNAQLIAITT